MKYFTCLLLFAFTALGSSAWAKVEPAQRLKGTIERSLDVIYGEAYAASTLEEKQTLIRESVEQQFDLDILIRRAIGRNWDLMNAEEQQQVLELVKQLVVKSYIKGLEGKARPELSFGETIQISDKRMEIPSVVVAGEKTIHVLYRLGRMKTGWEIYDIVAEDISVVSNYRQQFDDHFRRGSGAELIEKLQNLLQREDLGANVEL